MDEKRLIHDILQEEIARFVPYETRFAEIQLTNSLNRAEYRLQKLFLELLTTRPPKEK